MEKQSQLHASNVPYYPDEIKIAFLDFLGKQGASVKTRKNYKSDAKHFLRWFNRPITSITQAHVDDYVHYFSLNTPQSTLNRRLSTMRAFFSFCTSTGLISKNPALLVTGIAKKLNAKTIIENFERDLLNEGASKATVKNYVSDVRQFLSWFEHYAS